jgi:hypothetical protein
MKKFSLNTLRGGVPNANDDENPVRSACFARADDGRRSRDARGLRDSWPEWTILIGRWSRTAWTTPPRRSGVKAEYLSPETFDMVKMAQMIDAAAASKPTVSSYRSRMPQH